MDRLVLTMTRLIFLFIVLFAVSCEQKSPKAVETIMSEREIAFLLTEWKKDSMGCLRARDPEKMKIYANHLVGKDSIELVRQLGQPNFKYGQIESRHFAYTLECPADRPSYYNFYFHFNRDTIEWFSNPVLN